MHLFGRHPAGVLDDGDGVAEQWFGCEDINLAEGAGIHVWTLAALRRGYSHAVIRNRVLSVALALSVVAALGSASAQALPSPDVEPQSRGLVAAYSLVVPTSVSASGLIARAVLPGGVGCPGLRATVKTRTGTKQVRVAMTERRPGVTTLDAFSTLLVCEARMPQGAKQASIAGRTIPAAIPANVDRIALLGDSGCRLKGSEIQACNDPEEWPLALTARSVVRENPDLVIFLGDFFYREEACPSANAAMCGGSPAPLTNVPFTDSAWGWVADVFVPMAPILQGLPLYVIRGNHELCSRGGNGYFLFFDPSFGTSQACAPTAEGVAPVVYSPTTSVDLKVVGGRTLRLVNVDSSNGLDTGIDDTIAASLRPLFVEADRRAEAAEESWLLTHRPITGVISTQDLPDPPGAATTWSSVTNAFASSGLLGNFDLSLSSHIHVAQAIQVPGLPGEIVLGNAGTQLEPSTGYQIPAYGPLADGFGVPLTTAVPQIPTASALTTWVRFGYAVATPAKSGWKFEMKDVEGTGFATCRVVKGDVACG